MAGSHQLPLGRVAALGLAAALSLMLQYLAIHIHPHLMNFRDGGNKSFLSQSAGEKSQLLNNRQEILGGGAECSHPKSYIHQISSLNLSAIKDVRKNGVLSKERWKYGGISKCGNTGFHITDFRQGCRPPPSEESLLQLCFLLPVLPGYLPEAESAITLFHDNVTAIVCLHIKDLARLVWIKVEATNID
ncbi:hypothetical protein DFH09DRAFT_1085795 [Mycena vulgaris]|nr:hypothetical protein DFH09DRAFT_1085795 [Mycena vulgaris]